ncbi:MAG: ABC transporter permease [Clostridia bacterium]
MKKILSNLYVGLIMLFLYAPIFVLIFYSFNDGKTSVWSGFTFKWYTELFASSSLITALLNSLLVAVLSATIATILGTLAAIGINNFRGFSKRLTMNISNIPIINPEIVTGVSIMLLFVFAGQIFHFEMGFTTVLLAHIGFSTPYIILNVAPRLRVRDKNIYDAALDLGCNERTAFFKVVVPEILPGVLSGFLIAFSFSLDDFIITYFTCGAQFQTLPIEIYTMLKRRITPSINALSTIIFLTVLFVLIVSNILSIKKQNKFKQ